jgi:hypothetical protein
LLASITRARRSPNFPGLDPNVTKEGSGSVVTDIAILVGWHAATERTEGTGPRAAEGMPPFTGTRPAGGALAAPDKGGGGGVPALGGRLQQVDDLLGRLGALSLQGPAGEEALQRLRQVEPTATQGGLKHHHPLAEQPEHHGGGVVAGQIVPDQEQAQRGQLSW